MTLMNGYKRFWKPGTHQLFAFHKIKGGSNQFTERSLHIAAGRCLFWLIIQKFKDRNGTALTGLHLFPSHNM